MVPSLIDLESDDLTCNWKPQLHFNDFSTIRGKKTALEYVQYFVMVDHELLLGSEFG